MELKTDFGRVAPQTETKEAAVPRILFAGTASGCGKTTVTCAVLQALANRGMRLHAFKCGPDYIDPMFHERAIGAKGSNLDLFFYSPNTARYLLAKNAEDADVSILEGVMGYYDGMRLDSVTASSYDVARTLDIPAVLILPCKGAALSLCAVVSGIVSFQKDSNIQVTPVPHNGCRPPKRRRV